MVDIWLTRLKNLTNLSYTDLQRYTIKELLERLPPPMQKDMDMKLFLWKLSIHLSLNRLRKDTTHEQELLELYEKLKERYSPPPECLRQCESY